MRLSTPELTIAYTGDTGPTPDLVKLGSDADLFIMESTAAKKLLLTHFWSNTSHRQDLGLRDRARAVTEASKTFPGPVIAADEGLTLEFRQRMK